MNYATLCTDIQSVCENQFSAAELAMFVQQAEQKIYNSVQLPALRKTATPTLVGATVTLPSDFLFCYSLSTVDALGNVTFLLNKDTTFLREAYPTTTAGVPKHYAIANAGQATIAPTPAVTYTMSMEYAAYPESIVTAGTTWLGNQFDSALLNGSLVEALRFMKGEQDMVALYDKMFMESLQLLKQLSDGKLKQDAYREGQARVKVI